MGILKKIEKVKDPYTDVQGSLMKTIQIIMYYKVLMKL